MFGLMKKWWGIKRKEFVKILFTLSSQGCKKLIISYQS